LPIGYDAEVVATAFHALSQFVKTPILVRLSNRKILAGLLEALSLTGKSSEIYGIIDHAEKVPAEVAEAKLREQVVDESKVQTLLQFVQIRGPRAEIAGKLAALGIDNETFATGVNELLLVLDLLEAQGIGQSVIADMLIIRGLDYYTGTVFETLLPEYKNLGSICSGGRYDNLASNYTGEKFPGVGISIGLTRLFYCLSANNLLDSYQSAPVEYCVVPISDAEIAYAYQVVAQLINQGASADLCLLDKKLGDKIKYASKVAENVIIIGENEVKDHTYQVKNLTTGEQKVYELN
jgi:histidine--tRNA ligase